jgi:hypothetical protein
MDATTQLLGDKDVSQKARPRSAGATIVAITSRNPVIGTKTLTMGRKMPKNDTCSNSSLAAGFSDCPIGLSQPPHR